MDGRIEAYVDSSALIAFLDQSDSYHSLFRQLFATPPRLLSSMLVVAETHAWFLRRYESGRALQFLNFIENFGPLQLIGFGPDDQSGVIGLLRKFSDQDLTMTDAFGLLIMQRKKLKLCWSTDRHLGLTGVRIVVHQ